METAAVTESIESREAKFDLIMAFLRWMKAKHRGRLWTPDVWADGGMSEDSCPTAGRIHEFLREQE